LQIIDALRDSELLGGLDASRLEKISTLCRGDTRPKDAIIFDEGHEATELYLLQSGRVALEMQVQPVPDGPVIPTALEVISKGECFGWSALVEPHFYTLVGKLTEIVARRLADTRLRLTSGLGLVLLKQDVGA
jgi:signal-transduction protein with cAMP-binding, CBS, and nucleotidyltransferase domain